MSDKRELQTAETGKTTPATHAEVTENGRWKVPAVDIIDGPERITVLADMPGCEPETVDVTVERNVLTLQGVIQQRIPDDFVRVYREHGAASFRRSFALSEEIDPDKIEAGYRNGVLTLHLPNVQQARARRISVQGE